MTVLASPIHYGAKCRSLAEIRLHADRESRRVVSHESGRDSCKSEKSEDRLNVLLQLSAMKTKRMVLNRIRDIVPNRVGVIDPLRSPPLTLYRNPNVIDE